MSEKVQRKYEACVAKIPLAVVAIMLLALAAAALGAACGSSGGGSSSTASGEPSPAGTPDGRAVIPSGVTKPSDLKFAFFSWGSGNSYLQAGMKGAKDAAAAMGASIEIFDGKYDPAVQIDQVETALSGGRFNAFAAEPADSAALTPIFKQAMADGTVLVSCLNIPLGGRDLNEGDALWEPGTVTFVGGQTHDIYAGWMQKIIDLALKAYPGGGKAAAITGPKIGANGKNIDDVMKKMLPGTGIDLIANQETDYTTAKAYQVAQDILQANKDLKYIISNYSGMTQGIVKAIQEAGRSEVKVYDFGGNQWALDAVKSGDIEMTVVMLPYTEGYQSIEAIGQYITAQPVPKFINLTKDPSLPGTPYVTKDNVDQFKAQYE
jgi:ribose transport system substrate-binding protein